MKNIEDKRGFLQTKLSQSYLFSFFVKVAGIHWKNIMMIYLSIDKDFYALILHSQENNI